MKHPISTAIALTASLLGSALVSTQARAEEHFINIGTGGQTGVYYVVGQSICRMLNQGTTSHGIHCNAPSTGGSVANVNGLKGKSLDMGVVQSDVQYNAFHGTGKFADQGADEHLRALFSMHAEPLTVVARADAGINTLADLKGKRVNIGNPGSGQRATMEAVMGAEGWTKESFSLASELDANEQSSALSDNNIDAMVYVVGHPNGSIQEATTTTEAKLIPVEGAEIDALVAKFPYYAKAVIPGGLYRGNDQDVNTFGVRATVMTTDAEDEEVVYQTVKSIFENFSRFKRLHPAFANLNEKDMVSQGLSVPLHPGAARYYKERGWL
ncbi:TAXI family TRAP transporter solute-binding subunit [Pokkaliibacter sp. MBI-7]|uniref:TAXI family TRAP transporter solute-binding subunit n=1 Tax=Pokkaliibacter sp. MBI-7 TaxID=3040600 RepID=UPI00244C91AA|nr:TAXI family TRAP transporter solute-binding subunit [Pokkaliibacter sp. MBI-7]MDH2433219.1 TAXI family TRAP transporter solute-binding subunit [Pokkaliibacter sp. MBI-7]